MTFMEVWLACKYLNKGILLKVKMTIPFSLWYVLQHVECTTAATMKFVVVLISSMWQVATKGGLIIKTLQRNMLRCLHTKQASQSCCRGHLIILCFVCFLFYFVSFVFLDTMEISKKLQERYGGKNPAFLSVMGETVFPNIHMLKSSSPEPQNMNSIGNKVLQMQLTKMRSHQHTTGPNPVRLVSL